MAKRDQNVVWKDRKHFMWFPFSFTKYKIQNERLYKDIGFLNTVSDEVLLYRIIDISMRRSLKQRIFGTGTIILTAKVDTESCIHLINIKHPAEVKNMMSDLIEKIRNERNVVGREFYSSNGRPHMDDEPDCDCGCDDMEDTY